MTRFPHRLKPVVPSLRSTDGRVEIAHIAGQPLRPRDAVAAQLGFDAIGRRVERRRLAVVHWIHVKPKPEVLVAVDRLQVLGDDRRERFVCEPVIGTAGEPEPQEVGELIGPRERRSDSSPRINPGGFSCRWLGHVG